MKRLTNGQDAFVHEYIIDCNGTQAAIRAGYSPKTAESQASRLLGIPKIQEAIRAARNVVHNTRIMEYEEACEVLTDIARGNVGDYLDKDGAIDIDLIRKHCPAAVGGIEQRTDIGDTGQITTTTKFKTSDKVKALERLAKLRGWDQPAKVAHTNVAGEDIDPHPELSDAELIAAVAAAANLVKPL